MQAPYEQKSIVYVSLMLYNSKTPIQVNDTFIFHDTVSPVLTRHLKRVYNGNQIYP